MHGKLESKIDGGGIELRRPVGKILYHLPQLTLMIPVSLWSPALPVATLKEWLSFYGIRPVMTFLFCSYRLSCSFKELKLTVWGSKANTESILGVNLPFQRPTLSEMDNCAWDEIRSWANGSSLWTAFMQPSKENTRLELWVLSCEQNVGSFFG